MTTDCLGNPVTLQDASSLAALDDFVGGFIASEARAVHLLAVADTDLSALVQAGAAALHMFAETRLAPVNAGPYIARALAAADSATPRERRFVHAINAWVQGDTPRAIALHEEQAHEFPRDLVSLKFGHYHLFNRGDAAGLLRIALTAQAAAADVPYFHGMLAFAFEQCHLMAPAEAAARHALKLCRKEPWAQHALAHVMLTQGRLHEGQAFMAEVSSTWTGLNSFMLTHNWWHQALFALELDEHDTALALFDQQVWGVDKSYSQDQINAVSLLARLELAGVNVGERWHDLAHHLASRVDDQVLPFLDVQYLYGLARAERSEADALLRHMATHAAAAPAHAQPAWQAVALPTARGLLAHARGEWAAAAKDLAQALPQLAALGGSHAQRDLFSQVHLDALMRSGQWQSAQQSLQVQLNGQPESRRLQRQAEQAYAALGLGSVVASAAWS